MEITGDPGRLVREIQEMARRESADIISGAEAEAEKILADAEAGALEARNEIMASALAAAGRRREMLLASVPAEAARLRAERREALLDSIKAEAAGLLPAAAGPVKHAVLAALAAEAVRRMEGDRFIVSLSPEDRGAAAGLVTEIKLLSGRGSLELKVEELPGLDGGVVVTDAEGRQRWDNSFRARLERSWPEFRWRLAEGAVDGTEK